MNRDYGEDLYSQQKEWEEEQARLDSASAEAQGEMEMDKEIEKIDCKLWKNDYYQGLGDDRMFDYRDKVILRYGKLIGYRKLPKGKPPFSVGFVDE